MGSLIEFSPEFYAMVSAFWQVYQPMLFIWLVVVLGLILLISFGLALYPTVRSWLP